MAIISRISRLFRSDFNAVLDRIEEPALMLKQAVREMEEDIQSDVNKMKSLENQSAHSKLKQQELDESILTINQELDICFETAEDELARSRLKRKLELQVYAKNIAVTLNSIQKNIDELKQRISENTLRLQAMQQKQELFVQSEQVVSDDEFKSQFNHSVSESEIDMAFLKEKQARGLS